MRGGERTLEAFSLGLFSIGHTQPLTMNSVAAALLVWALTSPSSGGHGRGDAWPTHRACSSGGLEVFYQSCEQIYYAGPVNNLGFDVPQGEYRALLKLYNENHAMVACANATVICS
ncbi:lymphocyte antigen 86 isoform X6 [Microtus pennsylvanicus]|uniref:lymphocyte antigen 86 isoform X6 n=1 Tax=Microtus pennsylvanicus TaxID=10058 RepID=UPI003F6A731E